MAKIEIKRLGNYEITEVQKENLISFFKDYLIGKNNYVRKTLDVKETIIISIDEFNFEVSKIFFDKCKNLILDYIKKN